MTIEQRLEKLERTVRRYQLAFGILGLALLATTAVACSQQALGAQNNAAIPEVIRARKFEVVGQNGRRLVILHRLKNPTTGAEYGLIMGFNSTGVPIWDASADDNGGGTISVTDGTLRETKSPPPAVTIQVTQKTGGRITIKNGLDRDVAIIGSDKANSGLVTVLDVNGTGGRVLSGSR